MGESHENLLKAVRHYQESLDKYTENRNDGKLLHYLEKLYKLPIKVVHLEQTGVGRTVNGLRKLGGDVGDSAKCLVSKWKEMVVGEQEQEQEEEDDEEEEEDDEEDGYQTGEEQSNDSDDKEEREEKVKRETSSSHRKSDSHRTDDRVRKNKHNSSSKSEHESRKDRHKHHKHNNGHVKHKSHKRKSEDSSSDEEPRKRHKKDVSSDDDRHKRKNDSDSEAETKNNKEKRHRSDEEKKKHNRSKSKIRDSSSEAEEKTSKTREKHKEGSSKDRHKSSSTSKKEGEKKNEHGKKTKDKDRKGESSKSKESHKEVKSKEKSDDKKHKSSKSKSTVTALSHNGIDSGSGASFAEALGMCEPSSSKNSAKKKTTAPVGTEKKEKEKDKHNEKEKEKTNNNNNNNNNNKTEELVPKLLKEPIPIPEPLDINISSLLPPITPNYRPLGNLMPLDNQPKKSLNDYEALSSIMTSKNQRTKVYSGNKTGMGKVPTLFELCIRILQDNIDALEYTGGVPYNVLKPILEKSNPNQLYVLEHHNPYLIEDTDELWRLHCQKEFRNKKREEFESWREMYLRCLDERDAKLKALTANIKQAQDKSLPVRTTKLAYVDAVAKPPRNIARKQMKNGTAVPERKQPTTVTKLAALATAGEAGKVAVPNPGSRAADRGGGSSHAVKPKKAPLMLKSISSFKNRFKR